MRTLILLSWNGRITPPTALIKATAVTTVFPLESFGGAVLKWLDDKAEDQGLTVWHVAEKESRWFSPSDSSFMINYRVDNLSEMIAELRRGGVEVIGGPESHENGKFAWIMDPEGNKVELWEPMIWNEKNKSV